MEKDFCGAIPFHVFQKLLKDIYNFPVVLHLHDNISFDNGGGIEVYLKELMASLPNNFWMSIHLKNQRIHLKVFNNKWGKVFEINHLIKILNLFIHRHEVKIIHLHGVFCKEILERLPQDIPIVRSFHDLRFTCPGYGKYWYTTGQLCRIDCGISCYHNILLEKCGSRNPWITFKNLERINFEKKLILHRYNKVLVMSEFVKKQFSATQIVPNKLVLINYFSRFNPIYPFKSKDPPFKILWVGRINKTKGLAYFLKLAKSVKKKFPNLYSFEIVGDGIDRKNFDFSNVIFHGWQSKDELLTHLRQSFLLVFTSIYPEAFGMVGIEAFSQGVPVLAFDVGGVKDWLKHGFNGFLFNQKNILDMERTVYRLTADPEKYLELCQNIFEVSIRKNTKAAHLRQLKYIYFEIIKD